MEVTVAKSAGFCFGVKRAVDMVYEHVSRGKKVFTLGPIIHNEQVVSDLEKKGVKVIETPEEAAGQSDSTVIIRSHGVSKEIFDRLTSTGAEIIDATCPFVAKIHRIVREESQKGAQIVIVGDEKHPEVESINGWCGDTAKVVETPDEADKCELDMDRKVCIVAQTTFNYKKFQDIVDIFSKKSYDICIVNTICNATEERQTEAGSIARQSDAMLVIGGKHSSNTQKLFEICRNECRNTYFIQTLDDLDLKQLQSFRSVGITAGASTPNKIIKEVQSYVRSEQ